ncbi:hypothetical protein ACOMHN_014807 [Nucella lapillus]
MSEKDVADKETEEKNSIATSTGLQGTKMLATQVGGHQYGKNGNKIGMLDRGNGIVLKALQPPPRGTRELKLYQTTFAPACQNTDLMELRHFLPVYYGTEVLDDVTFLVMNNLTDSFAKPNVLDLKIGLVSTDPEATEEKKRSEELKYPPRKQLGFNLTGMMVHDAVSGCPQYTTKTFCRTISAEDMLTVGLGKFFGMESGHLRKDVVRAVLEKLHRIERWFQVQRTFAFYSSSLLIIYSSQDHQPHASSNPDGISFSHAPAVATSDTHSGPQQPPVSVPLPASRPMPSPDTSRPERPHEISGSDLVRIGGECNSRNGCVDSAPNTSGGSCGIPVAGQKRVHSQHEECPLTESASLCKLSRTQFVEEDVAKNAEEVEAPVANIQSGCSEVGGNVPETRQRQSGFSESTAEPGLSSENQEDRLGSEGKASISESKGAAPPSDRGATDKEGHCVRCSDPPSVEVRMIDFAHVFPATGKDDNYLIGLHKLIGMLEQLLEM